MTAKKRKAKRPAKTTRARKPRTVWTRTTVEVNLRGDAKVNAVAFAHRDVPGLVLTDRAGRWSVTHAASGWGIGPYDDGISEMSSREKAELFLVALAHVTDWTAPLAVIMRRKRSIAPRLQAVREVVFRTGGANAP